MKNAALPALFAAALCAGCLSIETKHTVDPIKLTIDVNMKVDEAVKQDIASNEKKPPKHFEELKALLAKGTVGVDRKGSYVVREGQTADEKTEDMLDEINAARTTRLQKIADDTGATLSDVRRSHLEKMRDYLAAGTWFQDEDGAWAQKQ